MLLKKVNKATNTDTISITIQSSGTSQANNETPARPLNIVANNYLTKNTPATELHSLHSLYNLFLVATKFTLHPGGYG